VAVDDLPPDPFTRVLRIEWTEGRPLYIDFTGDWDEWEVRAALREVLESYETEDAEP
jgi:hypothetical protein